MSKLQLKAARDAINDKNYEYAEQLCVDILEVDPMNYTAMVFHGLALKELERFEDAKKVYEHAIDLKPNEILAYQGLLKLLQVMDDLPSQLLLYQKLFQFYLLKNDGIKLVEVINRIMEIQETLGDVQGKMETMCLFLPESACYDLIKTNDIPSAQSVWEYCCQVEEQRIKEYTTREVNVRRTRLGAEPLAIIKTIVEKEGLEKFNLQNYYEQLLSLDLDVETNIRIAKKYLDLLDRVILYKEEKDGIKETIRELVENLHNAGCFSKTACRIELDEQNVPFKDVCVDRVMRLRFRSDLENEYPVLAKLVDGYQAFKDGALEDSITFVTEALEEEQTVFGYRVLLHIYRELKDCEMVIQTAEVFKKYIQVVVRSRGMETDQIELELELLTANACLQLPEQYATQCLTTYRSILESYPDLVEAIFGLGRILLEIGKYEEAQKQFEQVLAIEEENGDAMLELAWCVHKLGDNQAALEWLAQRETLGDDYLLRFRFAQIYWEMGDGYRTKEFCHDNLVCAIRMNPHYSPSFTSLGHYYSQVDHDLDRAAKCYSKAVSINPCDQEAVQSLIEIWISAERIQESKNLLEQFSNSNPRSSWVWRQLGFLVLEEDPESAITYFQTSLRVQPNDGYCWNALGEGYCNAGKYVASLKALDRALSIDPDNHTTNYLKGIVYQRLGMYPESVDSFERILGSFSGVTLFPILQGFIETTSSYGVDLFDQGYYSRAFEQYLKCIELCEQAISLEPKHCLNILKHAGDACILIYKHVRNLVEESHLPVINKLFGLLQTRYSFVFEKAELVFKGTPLEKVLVLGFFSFKVGFHFSRDSKLAASICRDASAALYFYHLISTVKDVEVLELATKYCRSSLTKDPTNALTWNTFGVLSYKSNPRLAQHAFIQAVSFDESVTLFNQNVLGWSNLGYFYLIHHEPDLATLCFQKCQFIDPEFALGWFGHAVVSDFLGNQNAVELYEHAFDIGKSIHFEVLFNFARGYLKKDSQDPSLYSSANYALLKISELKYKQPAAYNLLGLYLEQQGLYDQAISNFQNALEYLDDEGQIRKVRENLARSLCSVKRFPESIEEYSQVVDQGDAFAWSGYGLAFFFNDSYQESLEAFETALSCLDQIENSSLRNHITVLLAQVLHSLGSEDHIEVAKQQLLQCFQNDPTFVQSILCLSAIGIVAEDWTLAQSAISELVKLEPHTTMDYDDQIDLVMSRMFLLQGEAKVASRFLAKSIHRYPWIASRWSNYAEFIAIHTHQIPDSLLMNRCAEQMVCSRSIGSQNVESLENLTHVTRVSGMIELLNGDLKKSKSKISRAVLLNPSDSKNWLALGIQNSARQENELAMMAGNSASVLTSDDELLGWSHILNCNSALTTKEANLVEHIQTLDSIASTQSGFLQQVAFTTMGRCLFVMKEVESAIQAMKQAIALCLQHTHHWIAPFLYLAQMYQNIHRINAAMLCYDKATVATHDRTALLFKSQILLRQKDYENALNVLNEAVKSFPDSMAIKYMQTLAFEKIDPKKYSYRISKNKEFLTQVLIMQ